MVALWAAALLAVAPAQTALDRGRDLYLELEFTRAAQELERAAAGFESDFAQTGDFGPVAESLTLLAASRLGLKDETGARAAFRELLGFRPDFVLDVSTYGPKVSAAFQQARAASPERAALDVLCHPEADAFVDGLARGKTPLHLELPVGKHALRMEAAGHAPWRGLVELAPGGSRYPFQLESVGAPPPPPTVPLPQPARVHLYAAPFADLIGRSVGGEAGASYSLTPHLDAVGSLVIGPHPGLQAGVGIGTAREGLRGFIQLRSTLLLVPGSVAVGGGVWGGGSYELFHGRVVAGLSAEAYAAPTNFEPFALLALLGYEVDL